MTGVTTRSGAEPLIVMEQVVKIFHTGAGEFPALRGVSAEFYPGELASVVGKSGSGKSTLVNMITGIDHPTSGTVCIGERCVHAMGEGEMSVWRGRNLGIIFQFFQLLPTLTLLENVMMPMDLAGAYPQADRRVRARELLAWVGLEADVEALPAAVSGGEQQRAAIARALANDPPILVADEPTGNLDTAAAERILGIFHQLVAEGKTVLMVTHDRDLARRADRVLLLSDGELIPPRIVEAFPRLPHPRLLWLAHNLQRRQVPPGRPLQASEVGLFLVERGQLNVRLRRADGRSPAVARIGPGGFLSQLDLAAVRASLAGLSSGEGEPLELLTLERDLLEGWLAEAPEQGSLLREARDARSASGQDGAGRERAP
jgi:putative ABC transport system ATP-binding protein